MDFKAECKCTAIGSFPHDTTGEALNDIFRYIPDIPVWPQLPGRSFLEGMCPQYSEGIPTAKIDLEKGKISVDTGDSLSGEMEKFYEKYLAQDVSDLAVSEGYAPGFYDFLKRVEESGGGQYALKGHVTGPITWGLTVCDAGGRASYYNDMLKDGVIKGIAGKALWQAEILKKLNQNVIIFIDEPYLQSFGSATVPLQADDVINSLNETVDAIHSIDSLAGIHCCGKTDWSLLCNTKTDIINFDAFLYAESLSLYIQDVGDFLERGGILAWGVVPSTEDIDKNSLDTITEAFRWGLSLLTKKGLDESRILEQSLITPSCGAGSLSIGQSRKMLELTGELSSLLRDGK